MSYSLEEVIELITAVGVETFDIRTVTLGISLLTCADEDVDRCAAKVYEKVMRTAANLVPTAQAIERKFGIPIVNKRLSMSPIAQIAGPCRGDTVVPIAAALDRAAHELGVDFVGGFTANIQKGFTRGDQLLVNSIPDALSTTKRVCSSVNVASSAAGINMDAVYRMAQIMKETAERTRDTDGLGCAKLVIFCNQPEDNPFMAGACHGVGEAEAILHVGISGPGVVRAALANAGALDFGELSELIKKTSFKITRVGELVGREASRMMGIPFGVIDLSLAPTPAEGDSIADILEAMGLERTGCHGTTAALALLNDAVKKGGVMACTYAGGLSGAFIPVTEDASMCRAVEEGVLTIQKLEAMTCVCSVGLDMVAIPGDTSVDVLAGIIADEMAIGMINHKTTAVRLIPVPGKKAGDIVDFGGLLGKGPIMDVVRQSPAKFVKRGGRIPAPIHSMKN
ncbi:MAG TPA: PFL family protein [Candidatus Ozemobacteraceae bacterium]|nr:PFL family protein [Candidatus Ozemobacteraceae bacterium]